MTDGTITWMTGHQTHREPHRADDRQGRGRRRPARADASSPACRSRVTDDVDAAKATLNQTLQIYGTLPSYRAMLDKEGAAGPADVAILGDEETVRAGIQRYADAASPTSTPPSAAPSAARATSAPSTSCKSFL